MSGESRAEEEIWGQEQVAAETALRLFETIGVDDVARFRGQSLGYAETLAELSVKLVLVEMEMEARRVAAVACSHAKQAYDGNESYIYQDTDGRNSFAKFIAMRVVAEMEWLQSDNEAPGAQASALQHLIEAFELGAREDHQAARDPALVGRVALHLAEAGRWNDVSGLGPPVADKTIWNELFQTLRGAAIQVDVRQNVEVESRFDAWFRKHTDWRRSKTAIDPDLTAIETVAAARIRAWFRGIVDPVAIIKTIRWPD